MIPVIDPPSTTTRRGGLWGQVRCKQIQYTLHCMAPQGSRWSYSRGTNHFGSRFACFFLLYFPEGCSSPHRERYPATHRYHHTGLFTFPSPRLIEWAPFWKCTSTGLLSVQAGDHRAERGKVHTVGFLYHHVIQLYRQWGFLSLSYHISALSVWLASYWCFSGPADLAWNLKWEFPQVLCKCCFRPVAAKLCSCTTTRSEKNAAHGELDAFPAWVIYLEKGQVELGRHH